MFDIFNMLKKEAHTAPKQVTRDTCPLKKLSSGKSATFIVTPAFSRMSLPS